MVHTRSSSHRTPNPLTASLFRSRSPPRLLTEMTLRRFGSSAYTANPEGQPPSPAQHGHSNDPLHRLHFLSGHTRTQNSGLTCDDRNSGTHRPSTRASVLTRRNGRRHQPKSRSTHRQRPSPCYEQAAATDSYTNTKTPYDLRRRSFRAGQALGITGTHRLPQRPALVSTVSPVSPQRRGARAGRCTSAPTGLPIMATSNRDNERTPEAPLEPAKHGLGATQ